MGMDLVNEAGDRFRFRTTSWAFYLNLASVYGWEPAGTLQPDKYTGTEPWPGEYDWNAGQTVSSADAEALASALQRALADPERLQQEGALAAAISVAVRASSGDNSYNVGPIEDDTKILQEMIAFFRKGKFQIW